ncbi:MAG: ABC transporter permease [Pirellulaceae bacterium]|nr:ABC transporter permease [Pirellulaceae bacterium]
MILWKFSLKELRKRPGRAILTLLSVVIGVAAVVSVNLATRTTRQAYREMFQTVSGRTHLEVVAVGGGSFDQQLIALVRDVPGVKLAVPLVQRYTIMYVDAPDNSEQGGGRARLMALGVDPELDRQVRDYELTAGEPLAAGTDVLLDDGIARRFGVQAGDEVRLLTRTGLRRSKVAGLFQPRGGSAVAQGGLLLMTLDRAQSRFRVGEKIDSISIVLEDPEQEAEVSRQLAERLPAEVRLQHPVTRTNLAEETLVAADQGMRLATAFSLLLAVFVIMNTFLMNVGERRRQLAMLRAIGATRRQVAGVLYREALAMGLVGSVLGIGVGLGGGQLLVSSVGQLMQTGLPAVELSGWTILLAGAFGLGVSLLGAYLPARMAARLTPLEGMGAVASGALDRPPAWIGWTGLAMVASMGGGLAACIAGWLPIDLSVIFAVLLLLGAVGLLPALLEPLSLAVASSLFWIVRVEGGLARRQLLRQRVRTSLTIGVLFVAISTGIGLASAVVDNVHDVRDWYGKAIVGDFFVRAMMPDMAAGAAADLPEGIRERIAAIPGVEDLDALQLLNGQAADQPVMVIIREFHRPEQVYFDLVHGDESTLIGQLRDGQVVLGSVLAQRTGLGVGDQIPVETRQGLLPMRVAAVANDYLGGGLTLYMHHEVAGRLLGVEGIDALVVKADHRSLAAVERELEQLCDEQGLLLQSFSELVRIIDRMMSGVIGSLWGLLVLGLAVASFGVVNTLTMNVLEQTRELGVLRVVGMTRRQVRRTVFAQAAMMGCIGLAPGVLAGVVVAWLINLSTMPVTGHAVEFVLRPGLWVGGLAAGLLIVLAAAWLPAERAARLELTEALHYE